MIKTPQKPLAHPLFKDQLIPFCGYTHPDTQAVSTELQCVCTALNEPRSAAEIENPTNVRSSASPCVVPAQWVQAGLGTRFS